MELMGTSAFMLGRGLVAVVLQITRQPITVARSVERALRERRAAAKWWRRDRC